MSVWPQGLEHWGPSLNFQTAPQPPPLWQCSFWTRAPPCQELIWNFRAADTDFLSTRRGLPQVWRTLPQLGTPLVITRPQLRPFCSFLRTIHGRLLRRPTTLPPKTKQKPGKKPNKKPSQPCEAFRPLGSVWAQMGLWDENLTARKQHWVLNTVKNENSKRKKGELSGKM